MQDLQAVSQSVAVVENIDNATDPTPHNLIASALFVLTLSSPLEVPLSTTLLPLNSTLVEGTNTM